MEKKIEKNLVEFDVSVLKMVQVDCSSWLFSLESASEW